MGASNPEDEIVDSETLQNSDETHVESQNRSFSRVPVEAHLVSEIHDFDLIVNERVKREVQERLNQLTYQNTQQGQNEERNPPVVAAEVVVPKRIRFIPRSTFLAIFAMITPAAVAIGASIGIVRSKVSRIVTLMAEPIPTTKPQKLGPALRRGSR